MRTNNNSNNLLLTHTLRVSSYEPGWLGWLGYRDKFCLGFIWEISALFPRWEKVKDPLDELWRQIREKKQTCGKCSRQCKTMPSGPPEFIPPFIPVTGMKCSYGKISSPLTEISGTEPACPLIWSHLKFYKEFRGEARSRKPRASPVNRAHMKRPLELL